MKMMKMISAIAITCGTFLAAETGANEIDHTVYQVFRPIDMGDGITPPKDIYISMGLNDGLQKGSQLDVYRRISSFDNLTQKHMGDHMIPVGRLKVIYADEKTAIARADRFVSVEEEPALLPQSIMIGDVVRPTR